MVLFVSGRTDILTYYPKWFINRVKEGYIDTRNPYNPKLVSRIYFDMVDIIMFCTKNPTPFLPYLDELDELLKNVPLIFHITITPYKEDIEPKIAKEKKEIIKAVKYLASRYGKDRIFIRFDPILKSKEYPITYHIKAFKKLASEIKGSADNVVISFIDLYKNVLKNNEKYLHLEGFLKEDYKLIGEEFYKIAKENKLNIFTCGEKEDLTEYGFSKGSCLTKEFASSLMNELNKSAKFKRRTHRENENCNCVQTVDIGAYNSCLSLCKYCYANFNEEEVKNNYLKHSDDSSLVVGELMDDDVIKERID